MSEIKHLISISTYKESENIESLIKIIRQYDKDTKILLINDFSGDHTTEIVNKIKDKNIEIIERKKKLLKLFMMTVII